jgi:hypothetical protein
VPLLPPETIASPLPEDETVLTTPIVDKALSVVGETVNVAVATAPSEIAVEFMP